MRNKLLAVLAIACSTGLASCGDLMPSVFGDQTAVISGAGTAGLSPKDAARKILVQAASTTLDQGFQYFQIEDTGNSPAFDGDANTAVQAGNTAVISPGADITIKLFHTGDVAPNDPGIWDAKKIVADNHGPSGIDSSFAADSSSPSPTYSQAPGTYSPPEGVTMPPPPRCTAYGCDW
jgi:hypothetical protein